MAKLIPEICDILVSTGDPNIQDIAKKFGSCSPWLRPKLLSRDDSNLVDATLHALDWYESKNGAVDGVMLLQPTSPFRKIESVRKGVNMFLRDGYDSVFSVSLTHSHPNWMFTQIGCLK